MYEIYKFSFQIKFKITFCYLFNSSIFLFHTTALDLAREIGNQEILELLQNSPSQTLPVKKGPTKKGPVKNHPMKKVSPASTPVKTVPVTSESVSDTPPASSPDKNMPPKKRTIQKGPTKISRKKKD